MIDFFKAVFSGFAHLGSAFESTCKTIDDAAQLGNGYITKELEELANKGTTEEKAS